MKAKTKKELYEALAPTARPPIEGATTPMYDSPICLAATGARVLNIIGASPELVRIAGRAVAAALNRAAGG